MTADEQRRLGRDRCQPEPDRAGCGSGSGRQGQGLWLRRWRHPGDRPGQERAVRRCPLGSAAVPGVERERSTVRVDSKEVTRRFCPSVERRRFGCDGCEPERVEAGCGSGSVRAPVGRGRSARRRRTSKGAFAASLAAQQVQATRIPRCASTARGDGGRVSQSNGVESDATALNVNLTKQDADQDRVGQQELPLLVRRHPGDRPGGEVGKSRTRQPCRPPCGTRVTTSAAAPQAATRTRPSASTARG